MLSYNCLHNVPQRSVMSFQTFWLWTCSIQYNASWFNGNGCLKQNGLQYSSVQWWQLNINFLLKHICMWIPKVVMFIFFPMWISKPDYFHINKSHKKQTSGHRTEYCRDLHCIWAYWATMFLFKRKHSWLPPDISLAPPWNLHVEGHAA